MYILGVSPTSLTSPHPLRSSQLRRQPISTFLVCTSHSQEMVFIDPNTDSNTNARAPTATTYNL